MPAALAFLAIGDGTVREKADGYCEFQTAVIDFRHAYWDDVAPLTPGVGATADAQRLDRRSAATLTTSPVLPISYGDARPLLAALSGPLAPKEMGVILGAAVLLDTLLIRLLLLPAAMRLLGPAAWWTPRLLDRLPQGFRLRHAAVEQ